MEPGRDGEVVEWVKAKHPRHFERLLALMNSPGNGQDRVGNGGDYKSSSEEEEEEGGSREVVTSLPEERKEFDVDGDGVLDEDEYREYLYSRFVDHLEKRKKAGANRLHRIRAFRLFLICLLLTSFSVITVFPLTNFQFDPFGSYTNEELFVTPLPQSRQVSTGGNNPNDYSDMQLHSSGCSRLKWKRRSSIHAYSLFVTDTQTLPIHGVLIERSRGQTFSS